MNQVKVLKKENCKIQAMEWGTLSWFASRELENSQEMTMGKCVLKPGFSNPPHSHPNCEEILHVIRGKIKHSIEEGKEILLKEGDTICIPPYLVHNARNIGKKEAILMICFSSAERLTKGE